MKFYPTQKEAGCLAHIIMIARRDVKLSTEKKMLKVETFDAIYRR
jgi:hypothetical protein